MALSAGTRLGPYEIVALIGAGGMGEVWKARDTRLDRIVAIKVSQEKFSDRFECEARAVAAMNHPHICTLHDVGPNYLVMEYVKAPADRGVRAVLGVSGGICLHRVGHQVTEKKRAQSSIDSARIEPFCLSRLTLASDCD